MTGPGTAYTVVIPTIGRPSLLVLLEALGGATGPRPREILVVDDRPVPGAPLPLPSWADESVRVLRSGGRGPAAARNIGWREAATDWVVFVDDDVVPSPDWPERLAADLAALRPGAAGSQGVLTVPLPDGRRPTDGERNTAGLERAAWITADMAYRRDVLAREGGFDERFHRAYREDADLALRVLGRGRRLLRGSRAVTHPVRPAGFWASVRAQAGNADDVLMWRLHGRRWREDAGAGGGRLRRHVLTTGSGLAALTGAAVSRVAAARNVPPGSGVRAAARTAAMAGTAVWLALTAEFAAARIRPGPRDPREVIRMLITSVVIPPAAAWHRLRGLAAHWDARPWGAWRDAETARAREAAAGLDAVEALLGPGRPC